MIEEFRLAQARTALEQALSTGDPSAIRRTALTLAHLLEVLGRCREARGTWRIAQLALRWNELEPDLGSTDPAVKAQAWWSLGWDLQHEHGDPVSAVEAYRKVIATGGSADVTLAASMNLGELLATSGDLPEARRAFIRARAIAERFPAGHPHSDLVPLITLRLADLGAPAAAG